MDEENPKYKNIKKMKRDEELLAEAKIDAKYQGVEIQDEEKAIKRYRNLKNSFVFLGIVGVIVLLMLAFNVGGGVALEDPEGNCEYFMIESWCEQQFQEAKNAEPEPCKGHDAVVYYENDKIAGYTDCEKGQSVSYN